MKNVSRRPLPALLLLGSILAIHQLVIFTGYYPLEYIYPLPKIHFWADHNSVDIDETDKLWILGKSELEEEGGPTARWQPTLEAFPNDPAVAARVVGKIELPDGHLENAEKLAPENGWFDLIIAAQHADEVFRKVHQRIPSAETPVASDSRVPRKRGRRRSRSQYERVEVIDEDALDRTLAALARASGKPKIDPYVITYLDRWSASTKPANDVAIAYQNLGLWLNSPFIFTTLGEALRAFEHRMKDLAKSGEKDEFFRLLQIMEPVSWSLYDSSATTFELITARGQIESIAKTVSDSAEQLQLESIAKPYRERVGRFEANRAKRKANDDDPAFDDELLVSRFFNIASRDSRELREQITDQDLKPSVRAEQAHLSWRFYLWGFTLISLTALILTFASRWIKRPLFMPSRKWLALGVLSPPSVFLIFHYLTPWGGYDQGPG